MTVGKVVPWVLLWIVFVSLLAGYLLKQADQRRAINREALRKSIGDAHCYKAMRVADDGCETSEQ
jgi:hypothetical protein